MPIMIGREGEVYRAKNPYGENMHKPCLAQHAAFVAQQCGDAEWLRDKFYHLLTFLNNYRNHHRHACGLYFWHSDLMIGVDNDPCTYARPPRSSGSIYLNCLMLKEFEAAAYLADQLHLDEIAADLRRDAQTVRDAVQEHCWDERDGFYYSVDLNLLPPPTTGLHAGDPRHWHCLIQRIGVWSGFMALWAGIATPEQARRVVEQHYRDTRTFNAPYGVRTLSKLEKMYTVRASGNPSCWLGPVWGISNYMTFRGLVRYGFDADARELAERTIRLFGRDVERFGAMHEYYQPENGEPILNRGFQNWNYLVLNMIAWGEGKPTVTEF
jgi:putative isomerase